MNHARRAMCIYIALSIIFLLVASGFIESKEVGLVIGLWAVGVAFGVLAFIAGVVSSRHDAETARRAKSPTDDVRNGDTK